MAETRLTVEQENEIRARWDAATPGPWVYTSGALLMQAGEDGDVLARLFNFCDDDLPNAAANGPAIAHAPVDVRRLLAEVAALRGERDRYASDLREWHEAHEAMDRVLPDDEVEADEQFVATVTRWQAANEALHAVAALTPPPAADAGGVE